MGEITVWTMVPLLLFLGLLVFGFVFMTIFTYASRLQHKSGQEPDAAAATTSPHSRILGMSEVYMDMHNSINNLTLVWVLSVTSQVPVPNQTFLSAFYKLAKAHVMLTVRIREVDDNERYYEDMGDDFVPDIKPVMSDDWRGVYEKELSTNFNSDVGPLWRGRVVTMPMYNAGISEKFNYVILMSFHHGIADGLSGTHVSGEYIAILNGLMSKAHVQDAFSVRPPSPLPPALDSIVEGESLGLRDVRTVIKKRLQPFTTAKNAYLEQNPPAIRLDPNVEMKTEQLQFSLGKEDLLTLKGKGKEYGATLHGVFTAVAATALAKIIRQGAPLAMKVKSAVDVRSKLRPAVPAGAMGNLAILMEQNIQINPAKNLLELAKSCTEQLHKSIEDRDYMSTLRTLRSTDFMTFLHDVISIQKVGGRDDSYFYITNLGVVDEFYPSDAPVCVDHVQFTEAAHMYGSLFGHHLLTYKGTLHWTMHYYTHITNRSQSEKYCSEIKDLFKTLL